MALHLGLNGIRSRNSADLNGLQHIRCGDVWDGHNEVPRLHHATRFQERKRPPEIALHVPGKVETEGDQPPLQVQPLPHSLGVGEGEDGAVGPRPGQEGGHVAASCVHEDGVYFQSVGCRWGCAQGSSRNVSNRMYKMVSSGPQVTCLKILC